MITLNYEILDQFLTALNQRINNQIFFHFTENRETPDSLTVIHEVVLQFLGRPESAILALYQYRMKIQKKEEREKVLIQIQTAFKSAGEITLIQGRIQELIMSIA